jgi:hypothetical protein
MAVSVDNLSKKFKDLKNLVNGAITPSSETGIYKLLGSKPWEFTGEDWYKVFAYQFIVEGGPEKFYYTLPIPPQSYVVKQVTASQATATLGGVVEETGSNVFWLISMSGTTGTAISRAAGDEDLRKEVATQFRDKISTTGLLSGPLAGVQQAISKVGGVLGKSIDILDSAKDGDIVGAVSGTASTVNAALLPNIPYNASAVTQDSNGFTEALEMQRFFFAYSKAKEQNPNLRMVFRNYKTGQEWRCILQDPQFQQSVQNPMLIRYNINLKAWDVKSVSESQKAIDRFGPNGDLKEVVTISPTTMKNLTNYFFRKKNG